MTHVGRKWDSDGGGPSLEVRVAGELRAELARQGRSRRWLAEQTRLPLTSVARWVRGESSVGLDELDAMARVLGSSAARLVVAAQRAGYRPAVEVRYVAGEPGAMATARSA